MNLRTNVARGAVLAALCVATTALTAPQALAAEPHKNVAALAGTAGASTPFGALGPLTDLVIERIRVSDDVAASKFGTESPIDDPARESEVLERVREQAQANGVRPEAAVAFFRDQITASKVVQKGLFARWTAHPRQAPTTRPDLTVIRARLDRLTADLLHELGNTAQLRDKPTACSVELVWSTTSGAVLADLDALHRRALQAATPSVCG
ncbi:chorismate mutase [Streptomyces sp. NPDC047046]|uniref:chorismate mutase n=1 Tax=Streptomyces sp. NPDC047046 TaxID=3155378 RepID=UPI0033D6F8BE